MKKLLLLALLLCPLQAFAEEEDWYTYWSFGFSSNSYPGELDALLDIVEAQPGVDRAEIAIDMLGFYWPIEEKLILGFVISGTADAFTTPIGDMQINQYLYGASIMKFFGKETGDGFFLRGDLGFAKASITFDDAFGSTTITSDTGTGILLGVGYGVPVSEESRILFSINVHNNDIEGEGYSAVSLNIGGLW
ncbi:hypothetical protein ACFL3P_03830 [Pseudomonadota bacterium]